MFLHWIFFLIVLFCLIVFIILDACLHSNERERKRKKCCGSGQVGKWGEPGKSWRKGKHNQNVLYEKYLFEKIVKRKGCLKRKFSSE